MKCLCGSRVAGSADAERGRPGCPVARHALDEVAKATLEGITLTPSALSRVQDFDQLAMSADIATASLEPGKATLPRCVAGRTAVEGPVTVEPPRPQVTLLSKGTQNDAAAAPSPVHLGSADDLPVDGRLVFFLIQEPANFPRDEKVEVAADDGSFRTTLTLADGSLMLEDATTALGVVEPLHRFGSSAFGPLRARALAADGVTGDWLPLGTLVRLPGFKELHCPRSPARPCVLVGTNLFLAASISASSEFGKPTNVPSDFTGTELSVPHPANGVLYLKLRDDTDTVQTLHSAGGACGHESGNTAGRPHMQAQPLPAAQAVLAPTHPDAAPAAARRRRAKTEPWGTRLLKVCLVLRGEMRLVGGQFVARRKWRSARRVGAVAAVDALIGIDKDLRNGSGGRIVCRGRNGGGGALRYADKILGTGIGNNVSHDENSLIAATPEGLAPLIQGYPAAGLSQRDSNHTLGRNLPDYGTRRISTCRQQEVSGRMTGRGGWPAGRRSEGLSKVRVGG